MKDSPQIQTVKAAQALEDYLGMGSGRSLKRLSDGLGPAARTYSLASLERWSSAFDWPTKAKEHDARIAIKTREKIEGLQVHDAVAARVARLARAEKMNYILDEWLTAKGSDPEAIKRLSAYAIVQLAMHAAETERLDHGEATNRTESLGNQEHVFRIVHEDRAGNLAPEPTEVAEIVEGETRLLELAP